MSRPYNIGLDIGTSSIGWSVVDDQSKLVSEEVNMVMGFVYTMKDKQPQNGAALEQHVAD